MKKIFGILLSATLFLTPTYYSLANNTKTSSAKIEKNINTNLKVLLDNKKLNFEKNSPYIENNIIYVPLNKTMSFLGFENLKSENKNTTLFVRESSLTKPQLIIAIENNNKIIFQHKNLASSTYITDENKKPQDLVFIKNNVKYINSSYLLKNLGYNTNYDKKTNTFKIVEDKKEFTKKEDIDKYIKNTLGYKNVELSKLKVLNKNIGKLITDTDIGLDFEYQEAKDILELDVLSLINDKINKPVIAVLTKDKNIKFLGVVPQDKLILYPYKYYNEKLLNMVKEQDYYNNNLSDISYFIIFLNDNKDNLTAILTPNPYV